MIRNELSQAEVRCRYDSIRLEIEADLMQFAQNKTIKERNKIAHQLLNKAKVINICSAQAINDAETIADYFAEDSIFLTNWISKLITNESNNEIKTLLLQVKSEIKQNQADATQKENGNNLMAKKMTSKTSGRFFPTGLDSTDHSDDKDKSLNTPSL